ncbi:DUF4209 domain-containing protein [Actinokineospora sp. NBRC 105648]|uniref:DUF4209 domain-containing protein n=1 Tax=Actinokineospora sp. NBRC 105648 TaxID=3032206 RepID=UPI0024A4E634|nr:DUF4209 domain-containing protein [Actinokineospora sp. NBRC 105648]GLZ37863.1 hypothetical protein Acsp05_14870 [Actinokineospora sp. NBRC 105648]
MASDSHGVLTADATGKLINEAAVEADDCSDIGTKLRETLASALTQQAQAGQPPTAQWTIWAFELHAQRDMTKSEQFTPWMVFGDGTAVMPFLREMPDDCVSWWAQIVDFVTHPRATARLQHLLVARRHGNVGHRARRAAGGYLALAKKPDIYAVETVQTALDLALRTRQVDIVQEAVERATALANEALNRDRPAPGVLLGFIDLLVQHGRSIHDIDTFLSQARLKYRGEPHQEDSVVANQLKRAQGNPETIRELWVDRVELWITAGKAVEPLVRVAYLQKAVEHARASGQKALIERTTATFQDIRLESLGLTSFSVSTTLPQGGLERMLKPITEADDWQTALLHFANLGPFTGDVADNRQRRDELAREFVFSRLFPPMQLGGDNLPRFKATSVEEQDEYHLVKQELHSLQLYATVALEALIRVIARHPLPAVDELARHFASNPIIPPGLARAVARAFLRFWVGDAEAAAFTITPRIEALARNLLIENDEGIYRVQRNQTPGQYPGLRFLLDKLRDRGMDPSWHRFILVLCAHSVGWNIRNELAHGFLDQPGEVEAALLLQAAAYLALLR